MVAAQAMMQNERYPSIQIARALAAIAVLLAHAQVLPELLGARITTANSGGFGQAGVDIFFIISGFIISSVLQKPQTAGRFAARRALRILPFYWLFTLSTAIIFAVGYATPFGLSDIAASLAVLPRDASPVLNVGWSLEHELIFYAIVAILIRCSRTEALFVVMAAISAVSVAAHLFMPAAVDHGLIGHLLSLYHLQFFAGVALYRWRHQVVALPWLTMLLAGAILFPLAAASLQSLYAGLIPQQPFGPIGIARVVLWGGAGLLVLAGLLACEKQRPEIMQTAAARAMILIGGASYVLYLSHKTVIDLLGFALSSFWPTGWAPPLAEAIAIAGSIGFAVAFYRWIEEPMLGRLSRIADAISKPRKILASA
jgi:exopolysaccharide production protein ExoZ